MVNGTSVTNAVGVAQSYFYTVIVGIVILLAGFGLGILVQKLLYKLLQEIGLNKIMNVNRTNFFSGIKRHHPKFYWLVVYSER